jgi:hypothetical protein
MCAEKSARACYGTEAFALGGFTETLTTDSASQYLCGKRCRSLVRPHIPRRKQSTVQQHGGHW